MSLSVVCTVFNEEAHLDALLTSLAGQTDVEDIVIVDAASTDRTPEILAEWAHRLPHLVIVSKPCGRSEGRNLGVARAQGRLLAFIDGDCRAEPGWAAALQRANAGRNNVVVAGRTHIEGPAAYATLHRVELPHRGQDTTWPSCNLAYPRALFDQLGGFDPEFVTAEDIDLNFRAVDGGATIVHAADAVVVARSRTTLRAFLRQAYWNGFGRKQLTRKHGRLWRDYKFAQLLRLQAASLTGLLRLAAGLVGYLDAKRGRQPPHRRQEGLRARSGGPAT